MNQPPAAFTSPSAWRPPRVYHYIVFPTWTCWLATQAQLHPAFGAEQCRTARIWDGCCSPSTQQAQSPRSHQGSLLPDTSLVHLRLGCSRHPLGTQTNCLLGAFLKPQFTLGKGSLITLKNNRIKHYTPGVNYFMSKLYLPTCAANEYLIMLTALVEKKIYFTAFELNTIAGACML